MPISWGGFGVNVGIYGIHGVSGLSLTPPNSSTVYVGLPALGPRRTLFATDDTSAWGTIHWTRRLLRQVGVF